MDTSLPSLGLSSVLAGMPRAGPEPEQAALHGRARAMTETYVTHLATAGARLGNDVLAESAWAVQLLPYALIGRVTWEEALVSMARALADHAPSPWLGTDVTPDLPRPSAVWRVAAEADRIGRFFEAHAGNFTMLWPPGKEFSLLAHRDDFAALAGPPALLRAALHAEDRGAAATAALVEELEAEHGRGCMDGILAHYAPFFLPDP